MSALKFVQSPKASLAFGIGDSETELYGINITDINGVYLTMSDFGDLGIMTINPASPYAEIVSFTGLTYMGDGTTKFTGCTRGLLPKSPYTTGGTAWAHQANDTIIFSINPQMLDNFVQKGQDASITGTFTFLNTKAPRASATITYGVGSDLWFTTKEYVDGVAIAGAPDASTSTKGIGRISVPPVSATIPIFVGDNDPRMPGGNAEDIDQDMIDAIVGANSPSASNLFLTEDDSSEVITALKLLKVDSAGNIQAFSATAGESITTGDALFSGYYSTVSPVYDNKSYNSGFWSGASTAVTQSFTVGSGSNRALIVSVVTGFSGGGPGTISGISYGGVAMTLLSSGTASGNANTYVYYLLNPNSGANNITFTVAASGGYSGFYGIVAYSHSSVGSVALGAVADTNGTSITSSNSPYDAILGLGFYYTNGGGTGTTISSTILSNNSQYSNTSTISYYSGVSNAITESGSGAYTFSFAGGSLSSFYTRYAVRLVPSTTATAGYLKKASASTTFPYYSTTYQNFVGFASNTVAAGGTVNVVNFPVFNGLSGLTTSSVYYLSNTPGAISTTPGTTSKKVGIALSATKLLIAQ